MARTQALAMVLFLSFALGFYQVVAAQDTSITPERPAAKQQLAQPTGEIFRRPGTVITPPVSDPRRPVHTNYKIFVPAGRHSLWSATPDDTFTETPASLGCVYQVGPIYTGCNPANGGTNHPTGGWGAIALVDAYDDPTAASDLAFFDTHYGLPSATFTKVYANTSFGTLNGLTASCSGTPANGNTTGWDIEESLDIEYAHVMAPSAHIYLIEACSEFISDLLFAEEVAGIKVSAAGGGDISNSWGYEEMCVDNPNCGGGPLTQQQDDSFFYKYYWNQITYFAGAGDSGGQVAYPSTSPWVVSVGGTTINREANGNFLNESCWSDSGGGNSAVEFWANPPSISNGMGPWTDYQYELFGGAPLAYPARSTPDIAFDADPNSGVNVYDTDEGGTWYVIGGTSLASPAVAGIVNASNNRLGQAPPAGGYSYAGELNYLYSQLNANTAYSANFYDVTTGSNGHSAGTGYDQCTGIGTPRGFAGK
jgi:kumamolisin